MAVRASLRFAAASDPGKRRRNNEDRYYVDADRGIYAVVDGVGWHFEGGPPWSLPRARRRLA